MDREIITTNIKNLIPRKRRGRVNIDLPSKNNEPVLVDRIGKRWFRIVDGHHRYYKALESNKKEILIEIRRSHE